MPDSLNLTDASDEQLVAATIRGDTSAFGVIVERYWNMAEGRRIIHVDMELIE